MTKESILKFRELMKNGERSSGTIKKYTRDLQNFTEWLDGEPVSLATVNGWKESLQDKGSLEINMQYTKTESEREPVEGVGLSVYRVANVDLKEIRYTLLKDYEETKVSFEGMTAAYSKQAAKDLWEVVKQKNIDGTVRETDAEGKVFFADLHPGMYLVVQTDSKGEAKKYEKIQPFLVAVPMGEDQGKIVIWNYQVYAEPKTEIIQKPVPPSEENPDPKPPKKENVKTGDEMPIYFWLKILGASVVIGAVAFRVYISKSKDKDLPI